MRRREVRRLNYITRQPSSVAQWPTEPFRESLARSRNEPPPTNLQPQPDFPESDGEKMSRMFHLPASPNYYAPAVIYMTNDCGPLQLNQFQVQMAQFLVDRGFCLFCVLGYHQQLHGKYHCDYKFGNYTIAWTTKATFTIDDLARVVQTLPKCNKNGTNVHPDDKDDCAIMRPNAGTIYRKHLAGIYRPVDSLGQAKNNIHVIVVGHDLKGLSNEAVTVRRTRNNGTSAIVTTSLRLEMTILSAGKRGVARMWTYAPARDAAAMSSYALAKRQACDEGHDVTREQPTASELVQFDR